jgi:hypothetical protein
MFYLTNHVTSQVMRGLPWEFNGRGSVPKECFADKAARTAWLQSPLTEYHVYTLYEGLNENGRVSTGATGPDDANPPVKMHGLVADYDSKIPESEILTSLARMSLKPNWWERSLSGNVRLLWLFKEPLALSSFAFSAFLVTHLKEFFPLGEMAGLDEGALTPSRLFVNGGEWHKIHDEPVPHERLMGWYKRVCEKYNWKGSEPGISIDLTAVAARLRDLSDKFPRFQDWPGEFALGAQGPSFWVEGSVSPLSAIVRENGMQTFSGHAHKPFFTWSELLGAEWVRQFEDDRMGTAITDIYFDGRAFFIKKSATGKWDDESKDNLINELVVTRGLSREVNKKKAKTHSEVESAICFIRNNCRVKGAASFAFFPKGPMDFQGEKYLNLHTLDVLAPSKDPAIWGPDGNFPWLSNFLDTIFDPHDQLDFFLSWLARYYQGCYYRRPVSGQNVFIAGPVGCGKTFLNRAVIGALMGGFSEPKEFLLGEDQFNSELFDHIHWVIDDGSVGATKAAHRYFSEMVKRLAANRDMRSNEKFKKASMVAWVGRLLVTCNLDSESIRLIPLMDISIKDKLMLFKVAYAKAKFLGDEAMAEMLRRELSYLARFLLDFQTPAHCLSEDPRFGVKSYHESTLVASASLSNSVFNEILDSWMKEHFTIRSPEADFWEGTALQLRTAIVMDPTMADPMREFSLEQIKRQLSTLSTGSLFHIEVLSSDEKRLLYRIHRETHYPKPPEGGPIPESSKFKK